MVKTSNHVNIIVTKKLLSMWPTSRMFHLFLLWMSHDRPEWYESHGKKRDVGKVPRTLSGHLSTFCVSLFTRVGFILYIRTAIIVLLLSSQREIEQHMNMRTKDGSLSGALEQADDGR